MSNLQRCPTRKLGWDGLNGKFFNALIDSAVWVKKRGISSIYDGVQTFETLWMFRGPVYVLESETFYPDDDYDHPIPKEIDSRSAIRWLWNIPREQWPPELLKACEDYSLSNQRPPLRIENDQVFLIDDSVSLEELSPERKSQVLIFLRYLIDAQGGWCSSRDINRAEKKKVGGETGVRWDHVFKQLQKVSPKLGDLIESKQRRGYRLKNCLRE